LRRDDPAGATDICRPDQRWKIEKRHVEHKADRAVVNHLYAIGLLVQDLGPRTVIMLVAPFDIRGRDRCAVVKLETRAEPEGCTLGVLGEIEVLGERQVIKLPVVKVLDQCVVHRVEKIVRRGTAVMLQRVEPARRNVGVPAQHHAAARAPLRGGVSTAHERRRKRGRRDRSRQHCSPAQSRPVHLSLPYRRIETGSTSRPVGRETCRVRPLVAAS
jgi:hypothetical protein